MIPRAAALAATAFALGCANVGCANTEDGEARCAALQSELSQCVGSNLSRLDCSTVAAADIDRLSVVTQGGTCALLAGALPADGNLRSVTCRLLDVGCIDAVTPAPPYAPTKYPILLVNGIDTSPLFRYSDRISQVMGAAGQKVFPATLPPYEPPRERAPVLLQIVLDVLSRTHAAKVNLVCHSLGGLDCRYLVSPAGLGADLGLPDLAAHVASITTIGTAHRGTRAADLLLGLLPDGDQEKALDDFASIAGDWFTPEALVSNAHLRDALHALSVMEAPAFNAQIVDAPEVHYESWAGYSSPFGARSSSYVSALSDLCKPSAGGDGLLGYGKQDYMALLLAPFTDTVGKVEGTTDRVPNDGFVTVASAAWGDFRGCVPADHMEQLGQHNLPDVNVQNGFDVARFYADLAGDLAAGGF